MAPLGRAMSALLLLMLLAFLVPAQTATPPTLSPKVSVGTGQEPVGVQQRATIVFSCDLTLPSNAGDFLYDLFWYLNERSVVNFTDMAAGDLGQTDLKEQHWSNVGLGMTVKCSVRTRSWNSSTPSPHEYSQKFFAGLETDQTQVDVDEGGSATLRLRSTVPLPHVYDDSSNFVGGGLDIVFYTSPSGDSTLPCPNMTRVEVTFQQNCRVVLHPSNYSQWVAVDITSVLDNLYTGNREVNLSLSVVGDTIYAHPGRTLWKNYTTTAVKVVIRERDAQLSGKVCESLDDPHMSTFDGPRWGWENHKVGEFVLYRHNQVPQAVHVKYQYCGHVWNGYNVTCNCGVAVRAYDSLVVVDRCGGANIIEYRGCNNGHLVISENYYTYKVTLPTGTEVQFNIYPWYPPGIGSVSVFPSVADLNNTGGLCGLMDGVSTNDFTLRNRIVAASSDRFADDWRARLNESLFVSNPPLPTSSVQADTYHTCEAPDPGHIVPRSQSYAGFPVNRCPQQNYLLPTAFQTSCQGNRRRRDLHLSDFNFGSPSGWQPAESPVHRTKRQSTGDATVPEWTNGWTESKARDHCLAAFTQAGGLQLLETASGLSDAWQRHLDACVLDIKLTGGTTYTQVTVEVYRSVAQEVAKRNLSLLATEEGRQLMDRIAALSCPRDCSGHGQCNQGSCQCNAGYAGYDCSIDKNAPPQNPFIPQDGLCDTQTRACQSTPVLADNLFDESQVFCRFQRVPVTGATNGEVSARQTLEGQPWFPGQIQCPFPSHRGKRQTSDDVTVLAYYVSISNDNVTFSTDVTVVIYDSRCFSCHSTNLTCLSTGRCDKSTTPSSPVDAPPLIPIVASVVGGLVFLVVAALVGVLVFKMVGKKRSPVGHLPFSNATPSVPPSKFMMPMDAWK